MRDDTSTHSTRLHSTGAVPTADRRRQWRPRQPHPAPYPLVALALACAGLTITTVNAIFTPSCVCGGAKWGFSGGGTSADQISGVRVRSTGEVLYAGTYIGAATFGISLTNSGGSDIVMGSVDAAGSHLMAKRCGGAGDDSIGAIDMDLSDNAFIAGSFTAPSFVAGTLTIANQGGFDAFAYKFSAADNFSWLKGTTGSGDEKGTAIAVGQNSYIWFRGTFTSCSITILTTPKTSADPSCPLYTEWFYARLSPANGNSQPCSASGTTNCGPGVQPTQPTAGLANFHQYSTGTAGDGTNAYYVVGSFPSASTLMGLAVVDTNNTLAIYNNGTVGVDDAIIIKFDPSDAVSWFYTISSVGADVAASVGLDTLSQPVVCGKFGAPIARVLYGPTTGVVLTSAGGFDIFVMKFYGFAGDITWYWTAGGTQDDIATALFVDSNLITYVTGYFASATLTWHSGGVSNPATDLVLTNSVIGGGSNDIFCVGFNSDGSMRFGVSYGGTGDDRGLSVGLDPTNFDIAVGGSYQGTVTFGSTTLTSAGSTDGFVTLLDGDSCLVPVQPCLNGGTCVDAFASYSCICVAGYQGQYCQTDINECASAPCRNGATCTDDVNSYSCTCAVGFSGKQCQTNINECASLPCQNSGVCNDGVGGWTCTCQPGYSGLRCQTNINECASAPCVNGGTCIDAVAFFTCKCYPGYSGLLCQTDVNECASTPCVGVTSTCQDRVNSYACVCIPGFSGTNCQTNINECASAPCRNAATCVDGINRFNCTCAPGYTGTLCQTDINECASNPCVNGGTCIDNVNFFTCRCAAGFSGLLCQTDIDECASTPCTNGASCIDFVNYYLCGCPAGMSGSKCETDINECASNPCRFGGTCVDHIASFSCNCIAGYSGLQCQTDINECASNPCVVGTCTDMLNSFRCTCPAGYSGTRCETDINECASAPCLSGATCVDAVNSYSCGCITGFIGLYCQTNINECASNPCQGGSTCVDGVNRFDCQYANCVSQPCVNGATCQDTIFGFQCNCIPGYSGTLCQTEINECASTPCAQGGTCTDHFNFYTCQCISGFSGASCQTNVNECASLPCRNGATCVDGNNGFTCACAPGYSGLLCQTDINECASTPCISAVCNDIPNGYYCTCLPGFTGNNCQTDINECASQPCVNGGTCVDHVNSFSCNCVAGYSGVSCDTNINECASNPCVGVGALCVDTLNGYYCSCQPGYSGLNCQTDINECASQPCANSGTCVDHVNSFSCTCVMGYSGDRCQTNINECASQPCASGGTCVDGVGSYACTCVAGYSGGSCQTNINECASSPCVGVTTTCSDLVNGYVCVCLAGYSGLLCQTDINECASQPCANGGTCTDLVNAFTCACTGGYSGARCQTNANECASLPCRNGGTCVDGANQFTCTCVAGYSGLFCQTDIDECASNPCIGATATCADRVNGYGCVCIPGFSGNNCQTDINECASDPCGNGGSCTDLVNGFTCTCLVGFSGFRCQTNINECASGPCSNAATCVDGIDAWSCKCVPGYSGLTCQTNINECASVPCTSGGVCQDLLNGYLCLCPPGYSGANCQTDINECASTPCGSTGGCTDLVNGYTCACLGGYTGLQCQTDIDECASSPCAFGSTCVDMVNGYTCACGAYQFGCLCNLHINASAVELHVAPANNSIIDVGTTFLMWVVFAPYNRRIYLGTGYVTIYDMTSVAGTPIIRARIPASSSLLKIASRVEVQLNVTTATFDRASTRYAITVDDGAFLDQSFTPITGIHDFTTWRLFTRSDLHSVFTTQITLSALGQLTLHLPSPLPYNFSAQIQESLARSLAIPTDRIEIVSVDGNGDPTNVVFRIHADENTDPNNKSPAALLDDLRVMLADPHSAVYQQPLLGEGSPTLASAVIEPDSHHWSNSSWIPVVLVMIVFGVLFVILIPATNRALYPISFYALSFIDVVCALVVLSYLFNDPLVVQTQVKYGVLAMVISMAAVNLMVGCSIVLNELSNPAFYAWLFVPVHMGWTLLLMLFGMGDVIVIGVMGSLVTDAPLFRAPFAPVHNTDQRLLISSAFRCVFLLPYFIMCLYVVHLDVWTNELAWAVASAITSFVLGLVSRVVFYHMITGVQELNSSVALNTTSFAIDASGTGIMVTASPKPDVRTGMTPAGTAMRGDLSTAHLDLQLISSRYGAPYNSSLSRTGGGGDLNNTTTNRFYATPAPAPARGSALSSTYGTATNRSVGGRPRPLIFTPAKGQ